jgi:hypothetical protein
MTYVLLFFTGLLSANGIPHFVNGISGKDFHNPQVRKLLPNIPSPLLNVSWGLFNFAAATVLGSVAGGFRVGLNLLFGAFALGFVAAAIGLSVYFRNRTQFEST